MQWSTNNRRSNCASNLTLHMNKTLVWLINITGESIFPKRIDIYISLKNKLNEYLFPQCDKFQTKKFAYFRKISMQPTPSLTERGSGLPSEVLRPKDAT